MMLPPSSIRSIAASTPSFFSMVHSPYIQTTATATAAAIRKLTSPAIPTHIQAPLSSLCRSSTLSRALLGLRGGESLASAAFDLNRTRIRLEGLSAYGLIAILLMNSALALYTSVPKTIHTQAGGGKDADSDSNITQNNKEMKMENRAAAAFTVLSMLCILSGVTTSVIFSFLGLYSKTALGMGNDEGFIKFFDATQSVRKFGFNSMITSLICFKGSFTISVFLYFKGKTRYALSAFTLLLCIISWLAWFPIITAASSILYS